MDEEVDPYWAEDAGAQLREAEKAARSQFANAIRSRGLSADDIAMAGWLKMWETCRNEGRTPTPPHLWWAVRTTGLDMIRRLNRPEEAWWRTRGIVRPTETATMGDDEAVAGLQRAFALDHPAVIPLTGEGDRQDLDLPDPRSSSADDTAVESVTWSRVAAWLERRAGVECRRHPGGSRASFLRTCLKAAHIVAHCAASDTGVRAAYAEAPSLVIWAVLRLVEPDRFGRHSPGAFPGREHQADRRRAFRAARRVALLLTVAHRAVNG